ncbi:MAG: hypothetical protein KME07_12335 [Pegethrix bostrychoides GSE-TBD4-15B]|uniref:Uncharacterized protein n=1 Tax=Pegethrix bostrychoides GSE-TBD4-15B TaxID=2839662 RepID=A0A951PB54_9CYAN|nr:hypothetical protein [Pegethrix bostrychoides GSE-TBD4-15B]
MKFTLKFTQPLVLVLSLLMGALCWPSQAQSEIRQGILPLTRFDDWEDQSEMTLSTGFLSDLETDPNFEGDYDFIYGDAAQILDGYRIVERAGYFPENAGIPRDQQLARAEAIYRFYNLPNRNALILYRTPLEDTARYIIRRPGTGFLLPQ